MASISFLSYLRNGVMARFCAFLPFFHYGRARVSFSNSVISSKGQPSGISYFLVHLTTVSWFFDFDTIWFFGLSSCATSAAQKQFSRHHAIPYQIGSITNKCCFILFVGILQDNNANCVHSRIG